MGIEKYSDIINLPHYVSEKHPPMSMLERAAQFNPFAALTGYGDAVAETARLTEPKIELTESQKETLDLKLRDLISSEDKTIITIQYYIPDARKSGGSYVEITDTIDRVDMNQLVIRMGNGTRIPIDDIIDVHEVYQE